MLQVHSLQHLETAKKFSNRFKTFCNNFNLVTVCNHIFYTYKPWLTGDVISCALDCDKGTVPFYRNGKSMGLAFSGLKTGRGIAYFPAISLSQQESLRANFCATPLSTQYVAECVIGNKDVSTYISVLHKQFCVVPGPHPRPLQDSPHLDVIKANVLLDYLGNVLPVVLENKKVMEAGVIPDQKGTPSIPESLGLYRSQQSTVLLVASHLFEKRGAYVAEACLIKFLLDLNFTEIDVERPTKISTVLDLMWSLMQDFELKLCLDNLIISILSSYRFSPVTVDFKYPKMYLTLALSILHHQQTRRYLLSNVLCDKIKFPTFMHIKPPDDAGLAELVPTVWWEKYKKKDDKPYQVETREEKSQHQLYTKSCDELKRKIEELEQIQVEMLKVLLLHNDFSVDGKTTKLVFLEKFRIFLRENSGFGRTIHVNTCPLPVMLCFYHRMIHALKYYWDDFQKEDPSRFVHSQDAFMPIHEFWAETRDYFDFQRCGGLLSHINRILGGEVNKAQGLTVKKDGEVVAIDTSKQKLSSKESYPEIEMPSGNSLMELLDGIIMLYHTGAHKQLAKMCTLRENLKDFSASLDDTETKLKSCPPEFSDVQEEFKRSRNVFKEKVVEQARLMAWVRAVIFSKTKQLDVAWTLNVVIKTIEKASQFRLLFQYTPEFYIATVINSFYALKSYFHGTVPFDTMEDHENITKRFAMFLVDHFADNRIVNTDVRDDVFQALACFICFPSYLKILEELPQKNKLSMIRSLIGPYENRSWAQTNWILVRIWKGCGFGFRYTHLPNLVPSKVQPTEFGFASLQKPCPSEVFQNLLREVLLEDEEASTRFLDTVLNQLNWTFSEFIGMMQEIQQKVARTELRILEGRQLKICATCFEIAVYLMRVLEMVMSVAPELFLDFRRPSAELLLGRLTQLLCQVLNRVTTRNGMFDNVVSMYIQGLEGVTHFPVLAVTSGILIQLILKSSSERQKRALNSLLSDPGFQVLSLEFLLGSPGQARATPPVEPEVKRPFNKKDKIFNLQSFDEINEDEVENVKQLISFLKDKTKTFKPTSEEIREEEICTICYANPKSVEFVPCGHQSCRTCISHQMMSKKECFFCTVIITDVHDFNGQPVLPVSSKGGTQSGKSHKR